MVFFFLLSCQEESINEVAEESPAVEFDIPDSLAVYEMVNGERKRSTTVRLLTNAEKQKFIEKGVVSAADEVDLRFQFCKWQDRDEVVECDPGTVRCTAVTTDAGQDCLACFDGNDNMGAFGLCRDDL